MTSFLTLVQDTTRESGTISGVNPTTVVSQSGRLLKFVDWTIEAWNLIQTQRNAWRWMRGEFSGQTTAGTARYLPASFSLTRHARWITEDDTLSAYLTATGVSDEGFLYEIPWRDWLRTYGRGSQTNDRPVHYAISPAGEICFGPIPNNTYTIRGEYMKSPQVLAANADIPELPERFHDIIKWRALMLAGEHDEAPIQVLSAAKIKFIEMLENLERDQLPRIVIGFGGGPLA